MYVRVLAVATAATVSVLVTAPAPAHADFCVTIDDIVVIHGQVGTTTATTDPTRMVDFRGYDVDGRMPIKVCLPIL